MYHVAMCRFGKAPEAIGRSKQIEIDCRVIFMYRVVWAPITGSP